MVEARRRPYSDAFGARIFLDSAGLDAAEADYRAVARAALKLPPGTILEWAESKATRISALLEASSAVAAADRPLRLRTSAPVPTGDVDALGDAVDLQLPGWESARQVAPPPFLQKPSEHRRPLSWA
ncbi:hypothetical protein O6027_07315 [Sphingomonas aerolata]|uniref:hypothetical protein n=1 Tax=Sphingomonas aerolata TaxID=185951 RepID=UPI00335424E0